MNPARYLPLPPLATVATLAAGLAASAQETPYELEKAGWFVRVGAYVQTGMSVSVSKNVVPGPPTPGVYDDGFVLADLNKGSDGLTSNWGYLNNDQVKDGALQLSRINGLASPQSLENFGNSNLYGPEVVVGFEFYRFEMAHRDARLGFEAAFRYATYSGSDRGTTTTTVTRDVARYDLGGIVPPLAPYVGLPNYAGPLIGFTPLSQTTTVAHGTSTVSSDLTGDFYTGRFGMWMTFPVNEKLRVSMSFGFSSIYCYGTASFKEVRTYDDPTFAGGTQTASTHTGDWLPGLYIQPRVAYWFRDWMSVYVSAEYAHNGILRMNGLDYQARLDFGSTFGASGGVQFSF